MKIEELKEEVVKFKQFEDDLFKQFDDLLKHGVRPCYIICDVESYHRLRQMMYYWENYSIRKGENNIRITLMMGDSQLLQVKDILIHQVSIKVIQRIDHKGLTILGKVT